MERFFLPTRRLRDKWEANHEDPFDYAEVQLAVPVAELQILEIYYPLTFPDFWAYATGASDGGKHKLVWITKDTFLVVVDTDTGVGNLSRFNYRMYLFARLTVPPSGEEQMLTVWKRQGSVGTASHSFFWRMLATSESEELAVAADGSGLTSGPVLAQFLGGTPCLKFLLVQCVTFEEQHCRALSSIVRTDLDIALAYCRIESIYLADILGGNSCVRQLAFDTDKDGSDEEHILALAQALPSNNSIVELRLFIEMSDETWETLFHSMSTHPRLKDVKLVNTTGRSTTLSDESKTNRMRAIVRMLKRNTVVHTIDLPVNEREDQIFQNYILPLLEMNHSRFEVPHRAITKADPHSSQ
jgi:hypothetical protein